MTKFNKQAVWIAVGLAIVFIIPAYLSWGELSAAFSKMGFSVGVATALIYFTTLLILLRLKYLLFWTFVLLISAFFGFGVGLPPLNIFQPDSISFANVSLTLATVLLFWGIEKLIAKHDGSRNAEGPVAAIRHPDEMIPLNLDDKNF